MLEITVDTGPEGFPSLSLPSRCTVILQFRWYTRRYILDYRELERPANIHSRGLFRAFVSILVYRTLEVLVDSGLLGLGNHTKLGNR